MSKTINNQTIIVERGAIEKFHSASAFLHSSAETSNMTPPLSMGTGIQLESREGREVQKQYETEVVLADLNDQNAFNILTTRSMDPSPESSTVLSKSTEMLQNDQDSSIGDMYVNSLIESTNTSNIALYRSCSASPSKISFEMRHSDLQEIILEDRKGHTLSFFDATNDGAFSHPTSHHEETLGKELQIQALNEMEVVIEDLSDQSLKAKIIAVPENMCELAPSPLNSKPNGNDLHKEAGGKEFHLQVLDEVEVVTEDWSDKSLKERVITTTQSTMELAPLPLTNKENVNEVHQNLDESEQGGALQEEPNATELVLADANNGSAVDNASANILVSLPTADSNRQINPANKMQLAPPSLNNKANRNEGHKDLDDREQGGAQKEEPNATELVLADANNGSTVNNTIANILVSLPTADSNSQINPENKMELAPPSLNNEANWNEGHKDLDDIEQGGALQEDPNAMELVLADSNDDSAVENSNSNILVSLPTADPNIRINEVPSNEVLVDPQAMEAAVVADASPKSLKNDATACVSVSRSSSRSSSRPAQSIHKPEGNEGDLDERLNIPLAAAGAIAGVSVPPIHTQDLNGKEESLTQDLNENEEPRTQDLNEKEESRTHDLNEKEEPSTKDFNEKEHSQSRDELDPPMYLSCFFSHSQAKQYVLEEMQREVFTKVGCCQVGAWNDVDDMGVSSEAQRKWGPPPSITGYFYGQKCNGYCDAHGNAALFDPGNDNDSIVDQDEDINKDVNGSDGRAGNKNVVSNGKQTGRSKRYFQGSMKYLASKIKLNRKKKLGGDKNRQLQKPAMDTRKNKAKDALSSESSLTDTLESPESSLDGKVDTFAISNGKDDAGQFSMIRSFQQLRNDFFPKMSDSALVDEFNNLLKEQGLSKEVRKEILAKAKIVLSCELKDEDHADADDRPSPEFDFENEIVEPPIEVFDAQDDGTTKVFVDETVVDEIDKFVASNWRAQLFRHISRKKKSMKRLPGLSRSLSIWGQNKRSCEINYIGGREITVSPASSRQVETVEISAVPSPTDVETRSKVTVIQRVADSYEEAEESPSPPVELPHPKVLEFQLLKRLDAEMVSQRMKKHKTSSQKIKTTSRKRTAVPQSPSARQKFNSGVTSIQTSSPRSIPIVDTETGRLVSSKATDGNGADLLRIETKGNKNSLPHASPVSLNEFDSILTMHAASNDWGEIVNKSRESVFAPDAIRVTVVDSFPEHPSSQHRNRIVEPQGLPLSRPINKKPLLDDALDCAMPLKASAIIVVDKDEEDDDDLFSQLSYDDGQDESISTPQNETIVNLAAIDDLLLFTGIPKSDSSNVSVPSGPELFDPVVEEIGVSDKPTIEALSSSYLHNTNSSKPQQQNEELMEAPSPRLQNVLVKPVPRPSASSIDKFGRPFYEFGSHVPAPATSVIGGDDDGGSAGNGYYSFASISRDSYTTSGQSKRLV